MAFLVMQDKLTIVIIFLQNTIPERIVVVHSGHHNRLVKHCVVRGALADLWTLEFVLLIKI